MRLTVLRRLTLLPALRLTCVIARRFAVSWFAACAVLSLLPALSAWTSLSLAVAACRLALLTAFGFVFLAAGRLTLLIASRLTVLPAVGLV